MSNKFFKIKNRKVGGDNPVLLVAEISCNHLQNFSIAKKLVKTACEIGVGAIKLQAYTPDTMTLNSNKKEFQIKKHNLWKGKTLYELYKSSYTPIRWFIPLSNIADKYNIPLFSTVYDDFAVDALEKLGCPAYKIGGFELTDTELLKKVAKTKKPIILSRGMSTLRELKYSLSVLKNNNSGPISVLHCVNAYPTKNLEEMNLNTIPDIGKRFGVTPGLSEHSLTTSLSIAAVALGAKIIERHFILSRKSKSPDAAFSLEPNEMKELSQGINEVEKALGKANYYPTKKEKESIVFRRSLWVIKPIKKGEKFTKQNIGRFRPNNGLAIKELKNVLGKKAKKDIEFATPLTKNLIARN